MSPTVTSTNPETFTSSVPVELMMTQDLIPHLQACLVLARESEHHQEANQTFSQLQDRLATEHPIAAAVMRLMWDELLSTHRLADFLEQMSNIERQFAEQMTQSHIQIHQNYLKSSVE
ncbi:hypothetical protein [Egbenema bharatensis]|uniref:hypothetical protein n=1 Tax=Egbenema bharatensis TaxID=3463334 RepID=UPI003A8C8002